MDDKIKIVYLFNGGFVELINSMNDENLLCKFQRISLNRHTNDFDDLQDENLIRKLVYNEHETPFEHVVFTFRIKAPIFVQRQWFRHRIGSYNEVSQRYTEVDDDFFIPENVRVDENLFNVKQIKDDELYNKLVDKIKQVNEFCYKTYLELLEEGIQKEEQRIVLPLNKYTEWYWTVNLRSLMNFLRLRLSKHAQYEIREYQKAVYLIVNDRVPRVMKYFIEKYDLNIL